MRKRSSKKSVKRQVRPIMIRLDTDLVDHLGQQAEEIGMSRNQFIAFILRAGVKFDQGMQGSGFVQEVEDMMTRVLERKVGPMLQNKR